MEIPYFFIRPLITRNVLIAYCTHETDMHRWGITSRLLLLAAVDHKEDGTAT